MYNSEELMVEHALRRKIRTKILESIEEEKRKQKEILEEKHFRKIVREVIVEAVKRTASPHESTGINTLEDLLRTIVPTLEVDYKRLTTNAEQRQSFRAHIINAVENSLAPTDANASQPRTGSGNVNLGDDEPVERTEKPQNFQQSEEIPVKNDDLMENIAIYEEEPADQSKFIDINGEKEKQEKEEPADPRDAFGVDGLEVTGRNFAYSTYGKIETQIQDSYKLLASPEDKEIFFDYLITNLKLYFDRFEDELAPDVEEPTTPEYEAQVDKSLDNSMMENLLSDKILEKILEHIDSRI